MDINSISKRKNRIQLVKYTFLGAGIILTILIILLPAINNKDFVPISEKDKNKLDKLKNITTKHELSISSTVFEGLSQDFSPYKILAVGVDKIEGENYILNTVSAKYLLNDKNLKINALKGVFNSSANEIELNNDIVIEYEGITLNAQKLDVDLNKKKALSNEKIKVEYKSTTIEADSFETEEELDIIKFEGEVTTELELNDFK